MTVASPAETPELPNAGVAANDSSSNRDSTATSPSIGPGPANSDATIHEAVQAGDRPRVLALLEANPTRANSQPDRYDRCTPLHLAVRRRNTDLVLLLVEHGADVNRVDKYGLSPLDLAQGYGLDLISEFLSYHGARAIHGDEAATRAIANAAAIRLAVAGTLSAPGVSAVGPALISLLPGSARVMHALSDQSGVQLVIDEGTSADPAAAPAGPSVFSPGARNLRAGRGGFLVRGGDASPAHSPTNEPAARDLEITDGSQAVLRGTPVAHTYDASVDRTLDDLPPDGGRPVAFEFTNGDERDHRLAFSFVDEATRLVLECDRPVTLPPPLPGFPSVHVREGTTIHLSEETAPGRFYVVIPAGAKLQLIVDPTSVRPALLPVVAGPDLGLDGKSSRSANAVVPGSARTFVPTPFPFGGPPLIQAPTQEAPEPPPTPEPAETGKENRE